jgi:hypothetical protein
MRTGTVLHGPREGEIMTADNCTLVLPEPPSKMTFVADAQCLPTEPRGDRHYRFRVDDDGRGWWVEDRVFGNLS